MYISYYSFYYMLLFLKTGQLQFVTRQRKIAVKKKGMPCYMSELILQSKLEFTRVHVYIYQRPFRKCVFSGTVFPNSLSKHGILSLPTSLAVKINIHQAYIMFYDFFLNFCAILLKVALGVCFALKSWKEYLLLFTYLITLGKAVTLLLITKVKTNRPVSNLFVNRIPN